MTGRQTGRLLAVGVGPGDPELVTLKALRALERADVVAHFAKAGHPSNARAIVAPHLRAGVEELGLLYPMTTEQPKQAACYRDPITKFYDTSAATIANHLDAGRTVAVIAEGDPLFYGSYMHLHVRLAPKYPYEQDELERRLADADAAVVMKLGRHLPKVRRALEKSGRLDRAIYVERGTMRDAVMMRLAEKKDDEAPYFAVVLVPGWEQRP